MRFDLVDRVIELTDDRAVTLKQVTMAEEYLQDHFPSFPVLPGVLMLEAMVQAARRIGFRDDASNPLVLGEVRALKYNRFVSPGSAILAEVEVDRRDGTGELRCRGRVLIAGDNEVVAASGRFTMRPLRPGVGPGA